MYIAEDGSAKIADSGWGSVSSSASNGGSAEYTLDRDYFSQNTLDDFIEYLTRSFRKDFSCLKNDERLQKLFDHSIPSKKEIVLYHTSFSGVTGDIIVPTDFVVTLFPDKVEVLWGVAWCQRSAGKTETLDADYFQTHTIDDFASFIQKTAGDEFLKWFNFKNNQKILQLFNK